MGVRTNFDTLFQQVGERVSMGEIVNDEGLVVRMFEWAVTPLDLTNNAEVRTTMEALNQQRRTQEMDISEIRN